MLIRLGGFRFKDGGDLIFEKEGPDKVRITKADPKIWIEDNLMFLWYTYPKNPHTSNLHINWVHGEESNLPTIEYIKGIILTFTDDYGAKFIYVVKDYDFASMLWLAEWPD